MTQNVALIQSLPDVLADKSIVIPMRRRLPSEIIERIPAGGLDPADDLRSQCARWARDHVGTLASANPMLPQSLHDRAQDNWLSLLAIADVVGGTWPAKAQEAAVALTPNERDGAQRASIQLLADIRNIFDRHSTGKISSVEMSLALASWPGSPWKVWHDGRVITIRQIASLLKPFGIEPRTIRFGGHVLRGYERKRFEEVFERYLPARVANTRV